MCLPPLPQYACMPVRKMVSGTQVCRSDGDCVAAPPHAAAGVCVTPSLENRTRFIRVTHPPNTHMLFVGFPPHLQYAGTPQLPPPTLLLLCFPACWEPLGDVDVYHIYNRSI